MRLFKRKKKEERKLGWNDLTLTDLMQIKSISVHRVQDTL